MEHASQRVVEVAYNFYETDPTRALHVLLFSEERPFVTEDCVELNESSLQSLTIDSQSLTTTIVLNNSLELRK